MANKDEWGEFAVNLHKMLCAAPGIISDCEMLKFTEEGYSRGGRCTVAMQLPDTDWVVRQPAEGIFRKFPYKSNGKKIIMPLYLKLILSRIDAKIVGGTPQNISSCDYFVMAFNEKSVQVLLYGQCCTFPFVVTAC